ncbi:hypothetical protein AGMMS4957_00960 [Bacteroidia bacterium]|nr:hypothetical protein AGMMS4957_00960 [Bacteroidia bacterium]
MIRDVILNSGTMYELWQKLINKEKHSECIRFFAHKKGMRVLDIGCGPGNNAFRFLDTEYYGFDLSEDYIQQAESRWKGYDNIHFVCADVNDYFKHGLEENNKYDLIIMHGVLHHLTDEEVKHCVSAAKNVLKSDGEFRTLDGIYLMGGGGTT